MSNVLNLSIGVIDNASKQLIKISKGFYGLENSLNSIEKIKNPTVDVQNDVKKLDDVIKRNSKHMSLFGKIGNKLQSDFAKVEGFKKAKSELDKLDNSYKLNKKILDDSISARKQVVSLGKKASNIYTVSNKHLQNYLSTMRNYVGAIGRASRALKKYEDEKGDVHDTIANEIESTKLSIDINKRSGLSYDDLSKRLKDLTKQIEPYQKEFTKLNITYNNSRERLKRFMKRHKKMQSNFDDSKKQITIQIQKFLGYGETINKITPKIESLSLKVLKQSAIFAESRASMSKTAKAIYFVSGGYKNVGKEFKKFGAYIKTVDKKQFILRSTQKVLTKSTYALGKGYKYSAKVSLKAGKSMAKAVGKGLIKSVSLLGQKLVGVDEGFGRLNKRQAGVKALTHTISVLGQAMSDIVRGSLTRMAKGLGGFVNSSVKQFSNLEMSIKKVMVFGNIADTPESFKAIESSITKLAKTTLFSIEQISAGFEELSAVGDFGGDTNKLNEFGEAMIRLATATGETDLERVGKILLTTINAFGESAGTVAHVSDVLTAVANQSALSVSQIGTAMQYVNQTAVQAGYSIEETSAMIGFLSNMGFEASRAGTSLNKMFKGMVSPTAKAKATMDQLNISFFDSSGEMKDIVTIIDELNSSMSGLTNQQRLQALTDLFGIQGARTMSAMLNNTEGLVEMLDTMQDVEGSTQAGMDTMMNTMQGGFQKIMGTVESLKILLMNSLAPAIMPFIDLVNSFLNSSGMNTFISSLGEVLASLANSLSPIVEQMLPLFGNVLMSLLPLVEVLGTAFVELMRPFSQPEVMNAVVSVIGSLVNIFQQLLPPITQIITQLMVGLMPILSVIINSLLSSLIPIFQMVFGIILDNMPIILEVFQMFGEILALVIPIISQILMGFKPLIETVLGILLPVLKLVMIAIKAVIPIVQLVANIFSVWGEIISALLGPAVKWVVGLLNKYVIPAFTAIGEWLKPFVKKINDFLIMLLTALAKASRALGNDGLANSIDQVVSKMKNAEKEAGNLSKAFDGVNDSTSSFDMSVYDDATPTDVPVNLTGANGDALDIVNGQMQVAVDPVSTCDNYAQSFESLGSSIGDILAPGVNMPSDSTPYTNASRNVNQTVTVGDVNIYAGEQDVSVSDGREIGKTIAEQLAPEIN